MAQRIQGMWRAYKRRQEVKMVKRSMGLNQLHAIWSDLRRKRAYMAIKQTAAAKLMFDTFISMKARISFTAVRQGADSRQRAAIKLQGLVKIRKAKKRRRILRRRKAARKIQSLVRMWLQRISYLRMKLWVPRIQRAYRCYRARQEYRMLKARVKKEKEFADWYEMMQDQAQAQEQEKARQNASRAANEEIWRAQQVGSLQNATRERRHKDSKQMPIKEAFSTRRIADASRPPPPAHGMFKVDARIALKSELETAFQNYVEDASPFGLRKKEKILVKPKTLGPSKFNM
jgi:hypothetical protein